MPKKLELNEDLIARFKAKMGEDVSVEDFAIYKVRGISTEPLNKMASIYDGGKCTVLTVAQLVDKVANTNTNVGIAYNHDGEMLNVGRAFYAELGNEGAETVGYFYLALLKNDETNDVIKKLENGVLDEVSVNFKATHVNCSKCGWDYMGEDSDDSNWWDQTCANGHTVGVDGTHLELDGVDNFFEISIVNQGAAHNPKVLSSYTRSLFSQDDVRRLAASNKSPYIYITSLSTKMENDMTEEIKQEAEEVKPAEQAAEEVKPAEQAAEEVKPAEQETEEVKPAEQEAEEVKPAEQEAEEVKPAEQEEALANMQKELEAVKAEKEQVLSAYREQVKKVMVALNKTEVEIPESLDGISKLLEDNNATLLSAIPVGGVSKSANADKTQTLSCGYTKDQLKAFQVN